ncbi:hypothetical protein MKX01_013266, partial [Papaver californicum]
MLSRMQFMPLVSELVNLTEVQPVSLKRLIDLTIHGKGIYFGEYNSFLQDDSQLSLGSLDLKYPST